MLYYLEIMLFPMVWSIFSSFLKFSFMVVKIHKKLLFIIVTVLVFYGLTINISDCMSNYVPITRDDIRTYLYPFFNDYHNFDVVAFNINNKIFLCPKVFSKYVVLLKFCAPDDFKLLLSTVEHISSRNQFTNNYPLFFNWFYSFVTFFSTKGLVFLRDVNDNSLHLFVQNNEWDLYYKGLLECFNALNNKV